MFVIYRKLSMSSTASALNNNFSAYHEICSNKDIIAVVHKSTVNLVSNELQQGDTDRVITWKEFGCSSSCSTSLIIEAKFVTFDTCTVLVITSQCGIQVFDHTGDNLMLSHSLSAPDEPDGELFAQGITGFGMNLICVGAYDGSILSFRVALDESKVLFVEKIKAHDSRIVALSGRADVLGSADIKGCILVWREENGIPEKKSIFYEENYVVTGIALWREVLIASSASGMLKVYDLITDIAVLDVRAHSRSITSINVADSCGMLATVSEDGSIHVWQLVFGDKIMIEHLFYDMIPETRLFGVGFLDTHGNTFCVSAYESKQVVCYSRM